MTDTVSSYIPGADTALDPTTATPPTTVATPTGSAVAQGAGQAGAKSPTEPPSTSAIPGFGQGFGMGTQTDPLDSLYAEYWDGETPPPGYIDSLKQQGLNSFQMEQLWRSDPAWQRTRVFQQMYQQQVDQWSQFFGFTPGVGRWASSQTPGVVPMRKEPTDPGERWRLKRKRDKAAKTDNGQPNAGGQVVAPGDVTEGAWTYGR